MKTLRSLKRWEILILAVLFIGASTAFAAWFVAAEKITVSTVVKSLTAETYARATSAIVQVESASIYWSCEPTTFVADTTTGFTAVPFTQITLPTPNHIRNFRAIRSGGTDATLKCLYAE